MVEKRTKKSQKLKKIYKKTAAKKTKYMIGV